MSQISPSRFSTKHFDQVWIDPAEDIELLSELKPPENAAGAVLRWRFDDELYRDELVRESLKSRSFDLSDMVFDRAKIRHLAQLSRLRAATSKAHGYEDIFSDLGQIDGASHQKASLANSNATHIPTVTATSVGLSLAIGAIVLIAVTVTSGNVLLHPLLGMILAIFGLTFAAMGYAADRGWTGGA